MYAIPFVLRTLSFKASQFESKLIVNERLKCIFTILYTSQEHSSLFVIGVAKARRGFHKHGLISLKDLLILSFKLEDVAKARQGSQYYIKGY